MNKYEHSAQSAKIFGGDAQMYEEIHALIDSNKVVTPSIFGRFFLHHIDVGLPLLEKIFGEHIGKEKIPVKKILLQHLFEDYDQILTFAKHWFPALKQKESLLPQPDHWESFLQKASEDPRLATLPPDCLKELEEFFRLEKIIKNSNIPKQDTVFAIFGHALGGDLAAKILGKKFHGLWTSDVVTGYLNCRFKRVDRRKDPVPTLLDYEQYVPDEAWMHAPKNYKEKERLDPKRIEEKILQYEKNEKKIEEHFSTRRYIPHRRPCNLD